MYILRIAGFSAFHLRIKILVTCTYCCWRACVSSIYTCWLASLLFGNFSRNRTGLFSFLILSLTKFARSCELLPRSSILLNAWKAGRDGDGKDDDRVLNYPCSFHFPQSFSSLHQSSLLLPQSPSITPTVPGRLGGTALRTRERPTALLSMMPLGANSLLFVQWLCHFSLCWSALTHRLLLTPC